MAPELVIPGKTFDEKIDSWALGVILYELLVKQRPYDADTTDELSAKIQTEELDFSIEELETVSIEALDLVENLLWRVPTGRIGVPDILKHSTLQNEDLDSKVAGLAYP